MKESTGGALLMGLAAGIIIIFIILVAFFISYGKSFRIKNTLINKIEQNEGMYANSVVPGDNSVESFLKDTSVNYSGKKAHVCYNKFYNASSEFIGFNFEVIIYMEMDRTILGETFSPSIPIKGETKVIEKGNFYDDLKAGVSLGTYWPKLCSTAGNYSEITF